VSPSTGDKIGLLAQPLSSYVSSCQLLLKKKEDRHVENISYTTILSQLNPVNINTSIFEIKENSFKMFFAM
jgi:hypothetical protein